MNFFRKTVLFFTIMVICDIVAVAQSASIRADVKAQSLTQGKKMVFISEVCYNALSGDLIQHFVSPKSYYLITNNKGEAKMYFPDKNRVAFRSEDLMNSENSMLGLFVNNQTRDMGLSSIGYGISNVRYEESYEVSEWRSINTNDQNQVGKIELVHENFQPIYMAYFDMNGAIIKKIYYYNYTDLGNYMFPQKITEISYLNTKDSLISRTIFSNLQLIDQDNPLLNFKIPDDAQIVD